MSTSTAAVVDKNGTGRLHRRERFKPWRKEPFDTVVLEIPSTSILKTPQNRGSGDEQIEIQVWQAKRSQKPAPALDPIQIKHKHCHRRLAIENLLGEVAEIVTRWF